jgi:hypothetical protein
MSKQSDYESEVAYQVWCRGGNPDLVDGERCRDYYDADIDEDMASAIEYRKQIRRYI